MIVTPGYLDSISTLKDNSIKIVLSTQELTATSAAKLFEYRNKYVKFLISSSNISQLEADAINATPLTEVGKTKSQSQRLRNVMYRVWETSGKAVSFEDFYNREMENLITNYKEQI